MKEIYLATSYRNLNQSVVVDWLRDLGYRVYDFKKAHHGADFRYDRYYPDWQDWSSSRFIDSLNDPVLLPFFKRDRDAIDRADGLVLLLPSGRSAHLEAGYAAGQGKPTFIYLLDYDDEPELMYGLVTAVCDNSDDLSQALRQHLPLS